jgi:hypothetical protein
LKKDVFDQLEAHFKTTKKWKSLDNAYVNFTHWTYVRGAHDSVPYQKEGFYVSWLRHNAYICQSNFPSIDLVIPMAFRYFRSNVDVVSPECVSIIAISVKNCEGTEGHEMEFLSKEAVEGVRVVAEQPRDNSKKRKRNDGAKAGDDQEIKYTHDDDNLNIRLTLNALKFINPDNVTSATDYNDCWIEPSSDKPYIAFAMSMGETERKENLFIAEMNVSSYMSLSYFLDFEEFTAYCLCVERSHEHI